MVYSRSNDSIVRQHSIRLLRNGLALSKCYKFHPSLIIEQFHWHNTQAYPLHYKSRLLESIDSHVGWRAYTLMFCNLKSIVEGCVWELYLYCSLVICFSNALGYHCHGNLIDLGAFCKEITNPSISELKSRNTLNRCSLEIQTLQ